MTEHVLSSTWLNAATRPCKCTRCRSQNIFVWTCKIINRITLSTEFVSGLLSSKKAQQKPIFISWDFSCMGVLWSKLISYWSYILWDDDMFIYLFGMIMVELSCQKTVLSTRCPKAKYKWSESPNHIEYHRHIIFC